MKNREENFKCINDNENDNIKLTYRHNVEILN